MKRRFHRIDRSITPEGKEQLERFLPESSVKGLANSFRETMASSKGLALLEDSDFLEFLENYPRVKPTFLVAEEVEDTVSSELVIEGKKPAAYLDAFYRFIEEHNQDIEALQILRQSPQKWNAEALEELRSKLVQNSFSESNLQRAYELVHHKALADLISLIRSAFDHSYPVSTAEERVERAISTVTKGKDFTPEQLQWLGYIKQHLIQTLSIDLEDFEYYPIFERKGGRGKASKVFGSDFNSLINELNRAVSFAVPLAAPLNLKEETTMDVVGKLWGLCNTLRHDGIDYGDYIEQLTYLLFLKMADEKGIEIPPNCDWESLKGSSGDDLTEHYLGAIKTLQKQKGLLGDIFTQAVPRFNNPVNLKKVINIIDEVEWTALDVDVKAEAFEGLLEKAASEVHQVKSKK